MDGGMRFARGLQRAVLGAIFAACAARTEAERRSACVKRAGPKLEDDFADLISFLVYKAPISPEAVIFVGETTQASESKLPKMLRSVYTENYKDLTKRFRDKDSRSKDSLLERLEELRSMRRDRALRSRDAIFQRDSSKQAMEIQKGILAKYIERINRLGEGQVSLLWKYFDRLRRMKKEDRTQLFEKHQEYMMWALHGLKEGASFKRRMESSRRELNNLVKKMVMEGKGPSLEQFRIERAKFNLGGPVVSPSLFLQMAEESGKSGERVVRALARALLLPQKILASRLKGKASLDVKEGVLDFVKTALGLRQTYYLREEIDAARHLRSELICKFVKTKVNREAIVERIDRLQEEAGVQMLETLEQADPGFFKDFILYSRRMASDYERLLTLDNTSNLLKQELEKEAGLPSLK